MQIVNSIVIIILAIGVIFGALINLNQSKQLAEMQPQIQCLEQGRVYVGYDLCGPILSSK